MRSLNFIAVRQNLQKDPTSDFSGLVRGSKGYLQAHFSFDAEWTGCGKVAVLHVWVKSIRQDYLQIPVLFRKKLCLIVDSVYGLSVCVTDSG